MGFRVESYMVLVLVFQDWLRLYGARWGRLILVGWADNVRVAFGASYRRLIIIIVGDVALIPQNTFVVIIITAAL